MLTFCETKILEVEDGFHSHGSTSAFTSGENCNNYF